MAKLKKGQTIQLKGVCHRSKNSYEYIVEVDTYTNLKSTWVGLVLFEQIAHNELESVGGLLTFISLSNFKKKDKGEYYILSHKEAKSFRILYG